MWKGESLLGHAFGPPFFMCAAACLAVLSTAGYRSGSEFLPRSHSIVSARSTADTRMASVAGRRHSGRGGRDLEFVASTVSLASGKVFANPALSARMAHVPQPVVSQLSSALDRRRVSSDDIPLGSRFRLAYSDVDAGGPRQISFHGPSAHDGSRLLVLKLDDDQRDAYYFDDGRGMSGLFDRSGRAVRTAYDRYPVHFSRISSRFKERRLHPVLKVWRPHYGVDFAAPVGTPVRAVARGKVASAGWHGGFGRYVKLRHRGGLATGYGHLVRISAGLRPGVRVRRGEIIGYVGASGLATGAHLHFVVYRNGVSVDPLKFQFSVMPDLRGARLTAFQTLVSRLDAGANDPLTSPPIRTALVAN
jgi:murein DD-endopeptidase MepM/ murein hydrolase activator NlpD